MFNNLKHFISYLALILVTLVIFFNFSYDSKATNNATVPNPNTLDTITLPANSAPNNGGSPGWAMFFDLIAGPVDITVTQMSTASNAAASGSFTVEIFTRSGTALGSPGTDTAGWTSIGVVPVVQGPTSNGISLVFTIPSISIDAGDTVGVALQFAVAGPRYYGTGTPPYGVFSDTSLTLITGDARSAPFTSGGSYFHSRGLCGVIRYVVDAGPTTCNYIAGTWCPTGTYPNILGATYFGASDWIGDTLYFHRPSSTGAGSTTINRYTFGGTWTVGVPLPATRTGGPMITCDDKLYYIGGGVTAVNSGYTNTCYEYDPSTGAWTTKATMPASLATHSAACWGDSVIFVIGGPYSGSATNLNVHYYRVGSNTWGTITNSLPSGQGRRSFGLGISGNKLVMAAGYNTTYLKSTYVGTIGSDASQITWVAGPNVPTTYAGLSRPGGTAWGDYFFLVGGEQAGGGYHTTTYVYSVPSNTWFGTISPMPHGRSNIFNSITARCIDDTVRVFSPGGYSGSAQNFFDVTGCGPILVGSKTIAEIPIKYDLSQNYPNPFNPSTKINFTIPKTGLVTLKVYDILGKEIATLVNEVKNTGSYIVEFNGSNLSSGTYFYRMQAGDFVSIKKMMFIK